MDLEKIFEVAKKPHNDKLAFVQMVAMVGEAKEMDELLQIIEKVNKVEEIEKHIAGAGLVLAIQALTRLIITQVKSFTKPGEDSELFRKIRDKIFSDKFTTVVFNKCMEKEYNAEFATKPPDFGSITALMLVTKSLEALTLHFA